MDDNILDLSRNITFKIENFPYRPLFHLYRIAENDWESGWECNALYLDSIYQGTFNGGGNSVSSFVGASPSYADGHYFLELKLILREPGRYVTFVRDNLSALNFRDVLNGLHPEYLAVENDSGCPDPILYTVCYALQGDPHYEEFADEMRFLDDEVFRDRLEQLDSQNDHIWGRVTSGSIAVEWHGVFSFEVVE